MLFSIAPVLESDIFHEANSVMSQHEVQPSGSTADERMNEETKDPWIERFWQEMHRKRRQTGSKMREQDGEWRRKREEEYWRRSDDRDKRSLNAWKRRMQSKLECQNRFEAVLRESQSRCYSLLRESDDTIIKNWKEEIDTLLVFVSQHPSLSSCCCVVWSDTVICQGRPFFSCGHWV